MKYTLTCFLAILLLGGINAFGQQKLDYVALDDADTSLTPIQTAFNNKLTNVKVIGLGEATHGDKTTYGFNFNMVRYLVGQQGFRILFLEGPNSVFVPLNDFIKNDSAYTIAQIDTLVNRKIPPGPDRDQQMVTLLKWMKDYNLAHPSQKVKLMGMSLDLVPLPYMVNTYIKPYDPEGADALIKEWKTANYNHLDMWNDLFNWQDTHQQLIESLDNKVKQSLLSDFSNDKLTLEFYMDAWYIHKQNGVYITDFGMVVHPNNFYWKLQSNPDYKKKGKANRNAQLSATRDSLMAVCVMQGTGSLKSIVWAHDSHVIKPGDSTSLLMGDYLNRALGKQYFTVLTDYSQGGSIRAFRETMSIRESPHAQAGHPTVRELKEKYGMDEGIVFSTELLKRGFGNAGIHGAGIEGSFFINELPLTSFDALAVLKTLYPTDLIQ